MGDYKRKIAALFVALLFTLFSGGMAWAGTPKIGIVDVQKVMKTSKAAKEANARFLKDVKEKESLYRKKQKEVRTLQQEVTRESSGLSADALKGKREKVAEEIKNLKRLRQNLGEQITTEKRQLTKKIIKELKDVIVDYRKKNKYTLILEKRMVITADDSIDITDQIIRMYDKREK